MCVTSKEPGLSPPGIIVVGPERPGSGLYTWIPLWTSLYAFEWKICRRWSFWRARATATNQNGCSRVSAFGFVQSQNERGWMDVGQNIRSEKMTRYYLKTIVWPRQASSTGKWLETGQGCMAQWIASNWSTFSPRSRCPLFRRLRYAFGTVADHNRGGMIFGSLELMEWPVMHET